MEIICDKCGMVIQNPEMKTIREDDIEHAYFVCSECKTVYPICTTDASLRKRIEVYREMAMRLKTRRCTEQFHRRVQKMKEENVRRSRELAKMHPLASLLSAK